MKKLSAVMAAALVAALLVGGVLAGSARMSRAQGLMPEVVIMAEMPRLVMPTVEVRAMRTVAMVGQSLLVN